MNTSLYMKKLESDLKQDLVYNIVGSDIRKLRRVYKMHPTLKEVLQLKYLKNSKIITDNCDMNKKVEYVDVAEVPDVFNWIKPNTFLLTTAYAIKDDVEAQVRLISQLSELGATALSIKPQRFISRIPDLMIEEANKLGFPLIELSRDVSYSDVILGISKLIFNKKAESLQKSLDMNNAFTKVILEGGSFNDIAKMLSGMTKNPILIEDMDFNILAYADTTKDLHVKDNLYANILLNKERRNLALKNRDSKNPVLYKINKSWVYALLPINAGEDSLGFITMLKGNRNSIINVTAMKHASVVAALELNRIKSYYNKEIVIKKQLIDSLLSSDKDSNKSLSSQIIHFGWLINQHYISVAVRPKIDEKSSLELIECEHVYFKRLMQVLETNFYTDYPKVINHLDGKNILFFIGLSDEEAKDYKKYITSFIDKIIEKTSQLMISIYIGVGIPCENIYDIKSSYENSTAALELGKKINAGKRVIFYDELDFYEIIINHEPKKDLINYCNKYVGSLIKYQENDPNSNLLHTLEVFLDSGSSLVKTSQALYIHRNTLIYRLNKIKEILLYDLDDPKVQFKMNFALRIYKCLK